METAQLHSRIYIYPGRTLSLYRLGIPSWEGSCVSVASESFHHGVRTTLNSQPSTAQQPMMWHHFSLRVIDCNEFTAVPLASHWKVQ